MNQGKGIFQTLALKVSKIQYFDRILEKMERQLDIGIFHIDQVTPRQAIFIYNSIQEKYEITHEYVIRTTVWNQSEKRMFIWFMIFYSHFAQSQNRTIEYQDYVKLSPVFFHKEPSFLEFHFLCTRKVYHHINWTPEEDELTSKIVKSLPIGSWTQVARHFWQQTDKKILRLGRHFRQRYLNHLDDSKVKGNWTTYQDFLILDKVVNGGGRKWCQLIKVLGNKRTEHMIKNRYNSLVGRYRKGGRKNQTEQIRIAHKQVKEQYELQVYGRILPTIQRSVVKRNRGGRRKKGELVPQLFKDEIDMEMLEQRQDENKYFEKYGGNQGMDEDVEVNAKEGIKVEEKPDNQGQVYEAKSSSKQLYPFENVKEQDMAKDYHNYKYLKSENGKQQLKSFYPFELFKVYIDRNCYNYKMYEYHKNQMIYFQNLILMEREPKIQNQPYENTISQTKSLHQNKSSDDL